MINKGVHYMKKILLLLLMLIILCPTNTGASADEFALDISVTGMTPVKVYVGDTVTLTITVDNVSEDDGEKLWSPEIFIDADLMTSDVKDNITLHEEGVSIEYNGINHQGKELWPGESASGALSFTVAPDAPGGLYRIPIVLVGKRGPCPQGCHPWREEPLYFSINVIHGIPAISIIASEENVAILGDVLIIDFSLKNLGSAEALNMVPTLIGNYPNLVGQINIQDGKNTLQPDGTLNGSIVILTSSLEVGDYSIDIKMSYESADGKTYDKTKSVTFSVLLSGELTYEEQGNEAFTAAESYILSEDYENAIIQFSQAKVFYGLAELDDKVSECQDELDATFQSYLEYMIPPPPEPKEKNYLLIVGLIAGALSTFFGIMAGMARKNKKQI